MMFTLDFVNARGGILPLAVNEYFDLTNADGITSAAANISSNTLGGVDGDSVTNVQGQPRGIVLDLTIKNNVNVEEAKRAILDVVRYKQKGSLIWSQNERTWTIDGVVEAIEMPRWGQGVVMQISLHCSQPFWEDLDFIVDQISEAIDLHYFTADPFDMLYFPENGIPLGEYDTLRTKDFYNSGDVSVGLELTIVALGTVTNPIIYDGDGNFFGLGSAARPFTMLYGDVVVINTTKGRKSVTMNGRNLLDKVRPLSTWLQLPPGETSFSINSDDANVANLHFNITYKQRYV